MLSSRDRQFTVSESNLGSVRVESNDPTVAAVSDIFVLGFLVDYVVFE